MINALLINPESNMQAVLQRQLRQYCPEVSVHEYTVSLSSLPAILSKKEHNLLFVDCDSRLITNKLLHQLKQKNIEFIIVSREKERAYEALRFNATGFILRPIKTEELISAVQRASKRIIEKSKVKTEEIIVGISNTLSREKVIGIPTMEGFDFVTIQEIIRCEGLQRCTQVITSNKEKIISSYNIGEFRQLLEPFGFFAPHRSHLINLHYLKKYHREGTIKMQDNSSVPLSRRRRASFLDVILHL